MNAKLYELNAGGVSAPIIYEKDQKLPIVSFKVVFEGAGYAFDGKKIGLANLVCKLLNDGTKKSPSVKFAERLEADAIELRASCSFETASIEISCLREKWQNALTAIIELLNEPNFTQKALDKAKISVLGVIAKKQNDFDYIADSALKAKLFIGTPLAQSPIGTKDSIAEINLTDIKDFFTKRFSKEAAIIVAGGDLDIDEAQHAGNAVLTNLQKGLQVKVENYKTTQFSKEIIIKKPTEQAYIYFGSPLNVAIDSGDLYKSKVASFILGSSGFGSRLMESVRVKHGLAYSAYSRYSVNKSFSYFTGYMQTKLENEQKAKDVTIDVINEYVKNGATQKELDSAQKFLLGSEPLRNETLSQRLSSAYAGYYSNLGLNYAKKELEQISLLKLDELNAFIEAHPEIVNMGFAVVTK